MVNNNLFLMCIPALDIAPYVFLILTIENSRLCILYIIHMFLHV